MSDNPVVIQPLTDIPVSSIATAEDVFRLAQEQRLVTVNQMRHLESSDVKAAKTKLSALKDMTDQEIALKRLVIEEDSMHSEKEVAQHIAELSRAISAGATGNPFLRKVTNGTVAKPDKVNRPDIVITDTTMNARPIKVTFDKFISEHGEE